MMSFLTHKLSVPGRTKRCLALRGAEGRRGAQDGQGTQTETGCLAATGQTSEAGALSLQGSWGGGGVCRCAQTCLQAQSLASLLDVLSWLLWDIH